MAISFLKNLLGVKASGVVQSGIEAYVKWDPKGASEAELKTMEGKLDELGLNVAQARARYNEARKALDTVNALMHERMTAADMLQKQLDAEADPARKAALEKSLGTLVGLLEQMAPEVDQDAKDAASAREFLEQLEAAYGAFGEKLKHARADLTRAQREMERQRLTRENAADQAEAARQAAGLATSGSSVNVALEAMHAAAERDRLKAESSNAKASLLKPTVPEQDDPNISAALAAAKGGAAPPTSLADRLAALRGRAG